MSRLWLPWTHRLRTWLFFFGRGYIAVLSSPRGCLRKSCSIAWLDHRRAARPAGRGHNLALKLWHFGCAGTRVQASYLQGQFEFAYSRLQWLQSKHCPRQWSTPANFILKWLSSERGCLGLKREYVWKKTTTSVQWDHLEWRLVIKLNKCWRHLQLSSNIMAPIPNTYIKSQILCSIMLCTIN